MSKQIAANLGFILQLAGLVNLLPVCVGLLLNEMQTLPALFLVTVVFFALGFLMNSLSERKDLGFLSSIFFITLSFILLALIGAIPYFYVDPFASPSILDRFTNSFFESASGFTTTGFSFIQTPETLPSSLLLYRSTTELMGGVGIVFLLLSFFNSRDSLGRLGDALGIKRLGPNPRTTFLFILMVYGAFIAAATSFFYIMGYRDLVRSGSFAIDMLTGGFAPSPAAFSQYLNPPALITISLLMFIGSVNFDLLYSFLTRRLAGLDTSEIVTYALVLGGGTVLLMAASGVGVFDSFIHVLSMSSSTGLDYLNLTTMNDTVAGLFILLMLLGGCSFSMAGGIKMDRVVAFARSCKLYVNDALGEETTQPSGSYLVYEFAPALINIIVYICRVRGLLADLLHDGGLPQGRPVRDGLGPHDMRSLHGRHQPRHAHPVQVAAHRGDDHRQGGDTARPDQRRRPMQGRDGGRRRGLKQGQEQAEALPGPSRRRGPCPSSESL